MFLTSLTGMTDLPPGLAQLGGEIGPQIHSQLTKTQQHRGRKEDAAARAARLREEQDMLREAKKAFPISWTNWARVPSIPVIQPIIEMCGYVSFATFVGGEINDLNSPKKCGAIDPLSDIAGLGIDWAREEAVGKGARRAFHQVDHHILLASTFA
jgi:hypothetical protein